MEDVTGLTACSAVVQVSIPQSLLVAVIDGGDRTNGGGFASTVNVVAEGGASYDPDYETDQQPVLSYAWAVRSAGGGAEVATSTAERPTFTLVPGTYAAQLVVRDATDSSRPASLPTFVVLDVIAADVPDVSMVC